MFQLGGQYSQPAGEAQHGKAERGKGVFAEPRDPGRFNAARVSFDTVEWPNGADLCLEVLYEESVPV